MTNEAARQALLGLAVSRSGADAVVAVTGDVDPATAPQLEAGLLALVGDTTVSRIVLDLGTLSFLDSSGLRVFVTVRENLADRGATLALRNVQPTVARLLDITGLTEVIDLI